MKKQSNTYPLILLALGTVVGIIVIIAAGTRMGSAGTYDYGTRSLVGASPEEVGKFAQQYTEAQHGKTNSNSQILLARPIKSDELPALELGCPLSFASIEQPPLMLVILRGQFKINMPGSSGTSLRAKYMAYIFDMWSAKPVYLKTSETGGHFRTVLNDTSLPIESAGIPIACPTELPYKKNPHYGDTAPEVASPNVTIIPDVTPQATPLLIVPVPNPTVIN